MARGLNRKELKSDEFVGFVDRATDWLADNWRPLMWAAAAGLAAVLVWAGAMAWTVAQDEKAAAALSEALSVMADNQGDPAAAKKELRVVVDDFSGSGPASAAALYLARVAVDEGDTDTARSLLVEVSTTGKSALAHLATLDLMRLRADAGETEQVRTELEEMAAGTDTRLPRDAALYELGTLAAEMGDDEAAREHLTTLTEQFPESPYRADARQKLSELG